MWLVELYRAGNNAAQSVYSTNSCDTSNLENYIDPDNYVHELSLCNDWNYSERKKLLILRKGQGTVFESLINERMIQYSYSSTSGFIGYYSYFIIFEYLTESGFLMDFYVDTKIGATATIPNDVTMSDIGDLIEYIRNKNLNIIFGNSTIPKYIIHLDDNCKYYRMGDRAIVIKKPFLFIFGYNARWHTRDVYVSIYATPKLIDDINNHDSTNSTYDPDTDYPLSIDNVVADYFNTHAMSGIQYSNVSIYDDANALGYNLIRALLGPGSYNEACNISIGDIIFYGSIYSNSYHSLDEAPIYIYFPLLRPELDANGYFYPYPQYNPLDSYSKVQSLYIHISLSNSNSIQYFSLRSLYIMNSYLRTCDINGSGQLPPWNSGHCDFISPFRFLGAAECSDSTTDTWNTPQTINNANYLFMISKSPSSDTYTIKGVGCNEVTQALDFNAINTFTFTISPSFLDSLRKVTFSNFGYAIDSISDTLSNEVTLENSETSFVLFNDRLIDDENDFNNIYNAVREALPNSIICYFGNDSRIPPDLTNKVIHSDAVVIDLNTNETMPLVIKYIRYAQRLYRIFNV
jgi:hypothetical protein